MDVNQLSQRLTMRWIEMCARRGRHPRAPSAAEQIMIQVLLHAILSGPHTGLDSTRANIHGSPQDNQLWSTIQSLDKQMDTYENPDLLVRRSRDADHSHGYGLIMITLDS
jgi:hypothetical protein